MNVHTVDVNKNNQIIVNGNRIAWIDLVDLLSYGDDDASYKERFSLLLEDRRNGNKPNREIGLGRIKGKHKINRCTNNQLVDRDSMLEVINHYLDILVDKLYEQYKNITFLEKEDIKSELIIVSYELYDRYKGTLYELTYKNVKSFVNRLAGPSNSYINNRLCKYTNNLRIPAKKMDKLKELSDNTNIINGIFITRGEYGERVIYNTDNFIEYNRVYDIYSDNVVNTPSDNNEIDSVVFDIDKYNLIKAMDKLSKREATVLKERYGFNDNREKTLEEIGKMFNVHRERIRQIESRALRKLRRYSHQNNSLLREIL